MEGAKSSATAGTSKDKAVITLHGQTAGKKRKASEEQIPSSTKKAPKAAASLSAVSKVKARMVKKLFTAIKRTPHNSWQKKPYTEVVEGMDLQQASDLIGRGASTLKIDLKEEEELKGWLGVPSISVFPVSDKGMPRWVRQGAPPEPSNLCACIESVEVKYNKSTKVLSMKARTFLIGCGEPDEDGNCPEPYGS